MDDFSFIRRVSQFGTWFQTLFSGHEVGRDSFGNIYYRSKSTAKNTREKRWVMYVGEPEASKVPPEWHIWLHHTENAPLPESAKKPWQIPYQQNKTGTAQAYFPPGHVLAGGKRAQSTSDYQAWVPNN